MDRMSADNYIVIWKREDGKFCGKMGFASDEIPDEILIADGSPLFECDTIDQAYNKAEEEAVLEYGYHFYQPETFSTPKDTGNLLYESPPQARSLADWLRRVDAKDKVTRSEFGAILKSASGDSIELDSAKAVLHITVHNRETDTDDPAIIFDNRNHVVLSWSEVAQLAALLMEIKEKFHDKKESE